jgi:hypothetical protein
MKSLFLLIPSLVACAAGPSPATPPHARVAHVEVHTEMPQHIARAMTPDACRNDTLCALAGLCSAAEGECVAQSDDDCAQSQQCLSDGACSARDGSCVSVKDASCSRSEACAREGRCTARDGYCTRS